LKEEEKKKSQTRSSSNNNVKFVSDVGKVRLINKSSSSSPFEYSIADGMLL